MVLVSSLPPPGINPRRTKRTRRVRDELERESINGDASEDEFPDQQGTLAQHARDEDDEEYIPRGPSSPYKPSPRAERLMPVTSNVEKSLPQALSLEKRRKAKPFRYRVVNKPSLHPTTFVRDGEQAMAHPSVASFHVESLCEQIETFVNTIVNRMPTKEIADIRSSPDLESFVQMMSVGRFSDSIDNTPSEGTLLSGKPLQDLYDFLSAVIDWSKTCTTSPDYASLLRLVQNPSAAISKLITVRPSGVTASPQAIEKAFSSMSFISILQHGLLAAWHASGNSPLLHLFYILGKWTGPLARVFAQSLSSVIGQDENTSEDPISQHMPSFGLLSCRSIPHIVTVISGNHYDKLFRFFHRNATIDQNRDCGMHFNLLVKHGGTEEDSSQVMSLFDYDEESQSMDSTVSKSVQSAAINASLVLDLRDTCYVNIGAHMASQRSKCASVASSGFLLRNHSKTLLPHRSSYQSVLQNVDSHKSLIDMVHVDHRFKTSSSLASKHDIWPLFDSSGQSCSFPIQLPATFSVVETVKRWFSNPPSIASVDYGFSYLPCLPSALEYDQDADKKSFNDSYVKRASSVYGNALFPRLSSFFDVGDDEDVYEDGVDDYGRSILSDSPRKHAKLSEFIELGSQDQLSTSDESSDFNDVSYEPSTSASSSDSSLSSISSSDSKGSSCTSSSAALEHSRRFVETVFSSITAPNISSDVNPAEPSGHCNSFKPNTFLYDAAILHYMHQASQSSIIDEAPSYDMMISMFTPRLAQDHNRCVVANTSTVPCFDECDDLASSHGESSIPSSLSASLTTTNLHDRIRASDTVTVLSIPSLLVMATQVRLSQRLLAVAERSDALSECFSLPRMTLTSLAISPLTLCVSNKMKKDAANSELVKQCSEQLRLHSLSNRHVDERKNFAPSGGEVWKCASLLRELIVKFELPLHFDARMLVL